MPEAPERPKRSRHAEQRAEEGRPIGEAWSDVQRARRADIMVDVDEDRYIVRVTRGRDHVFERDGEHVTSFHGTDKARLKQVRRGTIRPVTVEEFEAFKALFI